MAPRKVTVSDLTGAARAAFGDALLVGIERQAGGSKKGVYRLTMDDTTTAIAYLWEESENYWPAWHGDGDIAEPFAAAVGLGLWQAAIARLKATGLRVPTTYLVDQKREYYPADLAIVEDFPGENLMDLLARDPHAAAPTMSRLASALSAMRRHRAPSFGKVALIDAGGRSHAATCEAAVLDFGLRCLAEAASRDERVARARDLFDERLRALTSAIRARAEYSVVHGELGLDHVLVDPSGEPVLIDVEDLMYFDVEWEHVFLRIRLGADYPRLAVSGLDEDRLALYMLAQRLSLTAGPLRLLDGDFPRRSFMEGVAEHNLNEALALVS